MPAKKGKKGDAKKGSAIGTPPRSSVGLPSNPAELEHALTQLLAPDNAQIAAATLVLNEFLKHPSSILAFLQQITSSTLPEARQMAAVLLRRRIKALWSSASPDAKEQLKRALLHQLTHEPTRVVRRSVAALISKVAEETVPHNRWPELLDFLFQCTRSPVTEHREMGLLLFRALSENIPKHLKPHLHTLQAIFVAGLGDADDGVRVEALHALDALVDLVDPEQEAAVMAFSSSIPPLVALVSSYINAATHQHDNEVVSVVFELFDSLAQSPAPVLDGHLPLLAPMMMTVLSSPHFELNVREQAALFLISLVQAKPKKLVRAGMVAPLLATVFPLLCDDSDHVDEELSLQHIGADLLDAMALNLPKRLTYDACMATAARLLGSERPGEKKGGLVVVAVVAEAFAEMLSPIIDSVLTPVIGLTSHPSRYVRTAAWMTVGQLAVHCDEAFTHYHRQVLPAIFLALGGEGEDAKVREKACFALEVFSDALDREDLGPYLSEMMDKLLRLLQRPDKDSQLSSLLAIKNIASVAQADFLPFFPATVRVLGGLVQSSEDDALTLRCAATECAGCVAAAVGKEAFAPYLSSFLQAVMQGMTLDFFELRESSYTFFGKLAIMLQEEFAPLLTTVLPLVLATCTSDEGMSVTARAGGLDDDDEDEYDSGLEDEDGDDEDDEGAMRRLNYSIRSGALDEKVAALECLATIFATQTAPLVAYVERCCVAMDDLMDFMHARVREAVTQALFNLVEWYHRVYPIAAPVKGQVMQLTAEHSKALQFVMPPQVKRLAEEDDREVVKVILELIEACVRLYGFAALRDCSKPLQKQLLLLLKEKATCQRPTDDDADDHAEHDVILDHTCELLAALALTGGPLYVPMLKDHAPLLLRFTEGTREPSSRGMAIGCFAEIGQEVGWAGLGAAVDKVVKVAVRGMEDVSIEMRRNSTFCTAILLSVGGAAMVPQWPAILRAVQRLMQPPTPGMYGREPNGTQAGHRTDSKEERAEERRLAHEDRVSEQDYIGCRDNAASVLARLLAAASSLSLLATVPFAEVMGMLLQVLPLTVDQQEAGPVYSSLIGLYRTAPQLMGPHTPRVLHVMATVFGNPDVDVAVQRDMIAFCGSLMDGNREAVEGVVREMTDKDRERFVRFVVDRAEAEGKHTAASPLAAMNAAPPATAINGHHKP